MCVGVSTHSTKSTLFFFPLSLSLLKRLWYIIPPNIRYYALVQEDMVKPFGVLCVATNDSPHTTYYALVQEKCEESVLFNGFRPTQGKKLCC
jgi:hypothetical protein